jgi:hypothetical protein
MKRDKPQPKTAARAAVLREAYQLVVECGDEARQRALYEQLTQSGYRCRVITVLASGSAKGQVPSSKP